MSTSTLPAMKTNPKFVFFTDFDGTITQSDSNDYLTDTLGMGTELRKKGNQDVLFDRKSFRQSFGEMMHSVSETTPYDKCIDILLKNIKLDVGFRDFLEWSTAQNVPVVVLSSGMEPIIRALLVHLIGPLANDIQIVSNTVAPRDGKSINEVGGWEIVFHDESHFGHDKSREIRPYKALPQEERPTMFYAGDGVSDLSAAKETDLLFAKKGHDLVNYCVRENVPFEVFEDWSSILSTVQSIVAGKATVQEVVARGLEEVKSGNA
ncbi:putative 2-hydroxy-3-keto-5-methylthiopentenyl-1-phosphate phosphatase [Coleophoma crateriformis]|uniref:Putative 2-hydroxy-3-keto-5-methylthiopentenyl-1-phosphate phosphatase n=2 Tax=Coleophoma TaxID=453209 RepID=A0A3D8R6J4_9HELO|nr:putative 2-hydroxy-3-keto-5-methylthiopentenyl-1-phosphate phosphatase [Coleophoma cylindrospora]RDW80734.1 putative 2-hydroxy-3-keto-5-methylthiopentenyl-1-phosphate phosphatase [Coleophoma crateriformis]